MNVPITDPIEYLLRRKFGSLPAPGPMPVSFSRDRLMRKESDESTRAVEAYKAELLSKSPAEIQALYNEELARHHAEEKAKADREEQGRFFNWPSARADFDHWSKAAHWTLDEAVALSFGREPEVVNWNRIEPYLNVSPFARQYGRVRDLTLRAAHWQQIFDPVLPGIFLAWAERTAIGVTPELVAAVKARGVLIADWKTLYDDLSKQTAKATEDHKTALAKHRDTIERLTENCVALETQLAKRDTQSVEPVATKEISTRERDSLLKLVIGMALGGYGYDPAAARSPQPSQIASDLDKAGVTLDVDTVRKWLKEAAELLPPKRTE